MTNACIDNDNNNCYFLAVVSAKLALCPVQPAFVTSQ